MDVTFTLDWMSATFPSNNAEQISKAFNMGVPMGDGDDKAKFGYTRSTSWESGAVLMWHDDQQRMGTHLVLSGSALKWIHEHGSDSMKVLSEIAKLGGRTSRIDLAIDVFYANLTLGNFDVSERLPYKGKGNTPKLSTVTSEDGGWTVYVGSRSSDKFLRIYNKDKEQGNDTNNWVRIELECKGAVAHYVGNALSTATVAQAYALTSTLARGMVGFKHPAWEQALSRDEVEISIPKPTERDTLRWLIETTAPALARVISERPSEDILSAFVAALRRELSLRGVEML